MCVSLEFYLVTLDHEHSSYYEAGDLPVSTKNSSMEKPEIKVKNKSELNALE